MNRWKRAIAMLAVISSIGMGLPAEAISGMVTSKLAQLRQELKVKQQHLQDIKRQLRTEKNKDLREHMVAERKQLAKDIHGLEIQIHNERKGKH